MDAVAKHRVFTEGLRKSFFWQRFVCAYLNANDLPAESKEAGIRPENVNREHYKDDEGDVWCGNNLIEVKSGHYRFTCVRDFPYDPIFVDDKWKYDQKVAAGRKPNYVIEVSQPLGTMIWLSVKDSERAWTVRAGVRNGKIDEAQTVYQAAKEWWFPIDQLLPRLRREL